MIYAAPDYPVEPTRDEDEVFEQHRDAGRGDGFLQLGRDKSARPPVERRSPDRAAGHSPPAARPTLDSGLGGGGRRAAVQPGVSFADMATAVQQFVEALRPLRVFRFRRSIVVTMQDGVTRRVWR